jgi:hypothetical protein
MTKLDKKLNIVLPLDSGWVHATPISYDIFEKYFVSISKAFSRLFNEGLGTFAGPRVAYLMLKKVAEEDGNWETPNGDGVSQGLMNEIIRLSNVLLPGEQGWTSLPLYEALRQGKLDPDEKAEVLNGLVFFTLASSMARKADLRGVLSGIVKFWDGQITLSDSTAFLASLPTLTPVEPTGPKEPASPIPS